MESRHRHANQCWDFIPAYGLASSAPAPLSKAEINISILLIGGCGVAA